MKIDVYDSYAHTSDNRILHFDVFVPSGTQPNVALQHGQEWLTSIGESPDSLEQARCHFCHTEMANPNVQKTIEVQGFFILQMEGCPNPT